MSLVNSCEGSALDQGKIWDHFQNEGVLSFEQNHGRLEFLLNHLKKGSRVLNIGVGNGALERMAIKKHIDIWSLDPNDRAIERLRNDLQMGERAQVGLSQSMKFPDEYFDAVVMSEVLEHLGPEIFEATLVEVQRVLRTNGRFVGTVPARENLADSMVVCPCCGLKFHRWGHKQSFTTRSLAEVLGQVMSVDLVREKFFIEWSTVGLFGKFKGLIKKALSSCGIGTYGIGRNIFFSAKKLSD